jgi:peptidoglycan/xylan/chitin deacetylase (PgdA/CDA1 family)
VVSLTFDDGTDDHVAAAVELAERALAGTFYVSSGGIGSPGHLTWEQLRAIAAAGHEVGGHTVDHLDVTALDADEARRQIADDRATLLARGFAAASFAYPYGAHSRSTARLVAECGYASARAYWGLLRYDEANAGAAVAETVPPADPFAVRVPCCIRQDTTLSQLQNAVARVEAGHGGWVVLVFHRFGADSGHGGYSTPAPVFSAFIDWLAARVEGGALVRTVAQVMGSGDC